MPYRVRPFLIGSVVSHLLGSDCRYLPSYIMVPGNNEQAASTRTGFLPAGTRVLAATSVVGAFVSLLRPTTAKLREAEAEAVPA